MEYLGTKRGKYVEFQDIHVWHTQQANKSVEVMITFYTETKTFSIKLDPETAKEIAQAILEHANG
jgi:hypothetical protein